MSKDRSQIRKEEKARRHKQKKLEIGQIALRLIAKHGVDDVSLRMVAKSSNYHPASLYEYFTSKASLLEYVSVMAREKFMVYLNQIITRSDGIENQLLDMGVTYLSYAKNEPEYFQVMFISLKQDWARFDPLSDNSPIKFLISLIQTGIDKGVIRAEGDVLDIAYHFWSLVHGMAILQQTFFSSYSHDWEEVHRSLIRITVQNYLKLQ